MNSFSDNFWDADGKGFEFLLDNLNISIETTRQYVNFFMSRCVAEEEHSKKLSKVSKDFSTKNDHGTVRTVLEKLQTTSESLVRFHQQFSTKIKEEIEANFLEFQESQKQLKKKAEAEHEKYIKSIEKENIVVQKASKEYVQKCKELATVKKFGSSNNINNKKFTDKAADKTIKARSDMEKSEFEFKASISRLNQFVETYEKKFYELAEELQDIEERRIILIKNSTKKILQIQFELFGTMAPKLYETNLRYVDQINEVEDINNLIVLNKTGDRSPQRTIFQNFFKEKNPTGLVMMKVGYEEFLKHQAEEEEVSTSQHSLNESLSISSSVRRKKSTLSNKHSRSNLSLNSEKEKDELEKELMKKQLAELQEKLKQQNDQLKRYTSMESIKDFEKSILSINDNGKDVKTEENSIERHEIKNTIHPKIENQLSEVVINLNQSLGDVIDQIISNQNKNNKNPFLGDEIINTDSESVIEPSHFQQEKLTDIKLNTMSDSNLEKFSRINSDSELDNVVRSTLGNDLENINLLSFIGHSNSNLSSSSKSNENFGSQDIGGNSPLTRLFSDTDSFMNSDFDKNVKLGNAVRVRVVQAVSQPRVVKVSKPTSICAGTKVFAVGEINNENNENYVRSPPNDLPTIECDEATAKKDLDTQNFKIEDDEKPLSSLKGTKTLTKGSRGTMQISKGNFNEEETAQSGGCSSCLNEESDLSGFNKRNFLDGTKSIVEIKTSEEIEERFNLTPKSKVLISKLVENNKHSEKNVILNFKSDQNNLGLFSIVNNNNNKILNSMDSSAQVINIEVDNTDINFNDKTSKENAFGQVSKIRKFSQDTITKCPSSELYSQMTREILVEEEQGYSGPEVLMEGWLDIKISLEARWNTHWVVLEKGYLLFFETPQNENESPTTGYHKGLNPTGMISLTKSIVVKGNLFNQDDCKSYEDGIEAWKSGFSVKTSNKTYCFVSKSQSEYISWLNVLKLKEA
ncbi:proline-serine-threonine phosphatase interacting protein [Lobulomyces angularis]|nr:proline-serine-threonine phosphatase interacting protein [Lobulomyces angularis]